MVTLSEVDARIAELKAQQPSNNSLSDFEQLQERGFIEGLAPAFRNQNQTGFGEDIRRASSRLGLGIIDIASDYAPETTAGVFGALTGGNITPASLEEARNRAISQNREYFEGRPFLESLPGRILGDPTTIAKATPGLGGAFGGFTEPTLEGESRAVNTAIGGALGKALGVAVKGGGSFISEQTARILPKKGTLPTQTAQTIKEAANESYKQAEKLGGIISPKKFDSFLDDLSFVKKSTPMGKALAGENVGEKLADVLEVFRGRPLTLQAAQEVDEALTDRASAFFINDKAQFRQVKEVQNTFRKMIQNATDDDVIGGKAGFDALQKGRKLWSQGAKMRDIEKIREISELTDNPRTAIKTQMRQLLKDDKRIGAYTKEERRAIAKAANTGIIEDTFRTFGSRLMGIIGGATGGPAAGAAAQAGSAVSRGAAEQIKRGQLNRVSREISDEAISAMGGRAPIRNIAPEAVRDIGSQAVDALSPQLGREGAVRGVEPTESMSPSLQQIEQRIQQLKSQKQTQNRVDAGTADPYYDRLAFVESSNNPTAQAKTSSAYGRYQITDGTAKNLIRKYGDKIGVDSKNWKQPENQEKLARALTQENRAGLSHFLRRQPTAGEMYIAHFAGINGAKKLLSKKNLNSKAATVMGRDVAMANKPIFFDLDKKGNIKRSRSVREVRDILKAKMES